MESAVPGQPEPDRGARHALHEGQARTLELVAQHSPIVDVMRSVCDLIEHSMPGAQAIAIRVRAEGTFDLVAVTPVSTDLEVAVVDRLRSDSAASVVGDTPRRSEFVDPSGPPTHRVWMQVFTGLDGRVLGALCVNRDWSEHPSEETTDAFDSAARLLQIGIEQHRAAQIFAATVSAERQRIANELHDDPIQEITVLSLMLQRIERGLAPDERAPVIEARKKADHAIDRMRRMLFELHPAVLEQDGLAIATEIYLEETMDPLGIDWTVEDLLTAEPDAATGVLIFGLIHEALANVARHSEATSVTISLVNRDGGIAVRIHDDGHGFDPTTIAPHRPGHLGIANVQYLARRTAGRFEVTSSPGHGCTVSIWIPADHAPDPGVNDRRGDDRRGDDPKPAPATLPAT